MTDYQSKQDKDGNGDVTASVMKENINRTIGLDASYKMRDLDERSKLLAYSAPNFRGERKRRAHSWKHLNCFS